MRFFLPLLLIALASTCVRAQQPAAAYGTARSPAVSLGVADAQVLDQLMFYIPGVGSPSREDLVRQNIKSYMMPIRQAPGQQLEWAYSLASAVEYYQNLNSNYKDNLSPDYITLNIAAQGKQPTIEDGLRLLIQQGTVSASIMPFGSSSIPGAVYSVPKFTIANFGYLFQPEMRARNRVFEVRKALSRGNPVIVEMMTDANFTGLQTNKYTPGAETTETHYLTVVGYDSEAETFELRGLYGRHWADAGYVSISFDDFGLLAQRGFVLIPKL